MVSMSMVDITGLGGSSITDWLYTSTMTYIPKFISAAILLLISFLVSWIFEKIVRGMLERIEADKWSRKHGLEKAIFGLSITDIISRTVKWYIMILFLREVVLRLDLIELAGFFSAVILWIPSWIIGGAIIIGALMLANFLKEKIKASDMIFNDIIGGAVYVLIMYFAVVLTLPKFGITNTSLLEDVFRYVMIGISVGIAIAIGIGFGFAIKEGPAKNFFSNFKRKK